MTFFSPLLSSCRVDVVKLIWKGSGHNDLKWREIDRGDYLVNRLATKNIICCSKRVQEHRRRRNPLRIPKDLFLDRLTIHTAWISCHLHFNLNKWVRKINGWTAPRNLQRVPKEGFLISFWLEKTKKTKKKRNVLGFWYWMNRFYSTGDQKLVPLL